MTRKMHHCAAALVAAATLAGCTTYYEHEDVYVAQAPYHDGSYKEIAVDQCVDAVTSEASGVGEVMILDVEEVVPITYGYAVSGSINVEHPDGSVTDSIFECTVEEGQLTDLGVPGIY